MFLGDIFRPARIHFGKSSGFAAALETLDARSFDGRYLEGGASTAFQLNYSPRGPRNRLLLGVGPTTTTFYRVDPVLRLDTLTLDHAGTGSDQVVTFAYNPASQIVSRSGTNTAYAWTGAYAVDRPYAANGQYTSA